MRTINYRQEMAESMKSLFVICQEEGKTGLIKLTLMENKLKYNI